MPQIRSALNAEGEYTGDILNRENIGKSTDEMVALWNADNPDDPVVFQQIHNEQQSDTLARSRHWLGQIRHPFSITCLPGAIIGSE